MNPIWRHIRSYVQPRALVLMYHRVASPEADIWNIAVSPENFESQLLALKRNLNVVPLTELTERLKNKKLKRNSVALTFDDGYIDNFLIAKPLLEKYELPATFFITSTYLIQQQEFWWDALENLILFSPKLPQKISLKIAGNAICFDLKSEAETDVVNIKANQCWKAYEQPPPTLRCQLFLELWQLLKTLPYTMQQQEIEKIKNWAKPDILVRPANKSITASQLQELARNELFKIGAHTETHAALACHSFQHQQQEMQQNKNLLQSITNRNISLLAYPYGSYNSDTPQAARAAAFKAAFTTTENAVTTRCHPYQLGRFQVKNLAGGEFEKKLTIWKNT